MAGWMGTLHLMKYALSVVGADQDKDGKYIVSGGIVTFLGMTDDQAEVVIDETATYYRNGQPCSIAGLLNSTSYGVRNITVIM